MPDGAVGQGARSAYGRAAAIMRRCCVRCVSRTTTSTRIADEKSQPMCFGRSIMRCVANLFPANDTMTDHSELDRSFSRRPSATSAAVIGGGPAGLVAALALAHFGVPTALVAPQPGRV